jgi:hypothetical protein
VQFIAGPAGKDALAKLGLPEARVTVPVATTAKTPAILPGGRYGLDLTEALVIDTAENAKIGLGRIKQALSMTQTGYRSLFWDDSKTARVNGGVTGASSTSRQAAQIANYQAALDRLSTNNASTGILGL